MRKKSAFDFTIDNIHKFDKSLGLDSIKFPDVTVENIFGSGMKAKKQKPKKTNPFQKRNSLIYDGGMPRNFDESEQRKNITNSSLFNFNPTGRIRQQAQQQ